MAAETDGWPAWARTTPDPAAIVPRWADFGARRVSAWTDGFPIAGQTVHCDVMTDAYVALSARTVVRTSTLPSAPALPASQTVHVAGAIEACSEALPTMVATTGLGRIGCLDGAAPSTALASPHRKLDSRSNGADLRAVA